MSSSEHSNPMQPAHIEPVAGDFVGVKSSYFIYFADARFRCLVILAVGVLATITTMRTLIERRNETKRQQRELLRHDQESSSRAILIHYTTTPAKVWNDFFFPPYSSLSGADDISTRKEGVGK